MKKSTLSNIARISLASGFLFLSGCGGSSDSSSGASTSTSCTAAQVAGEYRITLTVSGVSVTDTDTLTVDDAAGINNNQLSTTLDGVSLSITFNSSCNAFTGTASDGSLSGTVSGTKI